MLLTRATVDVSHIGPFTSPKALLHHRSNDELLPDPFFDLVGDIPLDLCWKAAWKGKIGVVQASVTVVRVSDVLLCDM